MSRRRVPFEVAGFVNRCTYVVDSFRGTEGFRWCLFVNDNFDDADMLPWDGESDGQEPPF
ncbi:hypothetical protein AEB_P0197 [Altererythrobacter sp. B11]|uniref:hypothetical protein n=1 Tax=Altererythrobacter sp. B11 TaxID=2060312 RepID=UPI000DC72DE8|nr:hypothetical protein [Altererythrobacter sp. B11]BBC71065.1 hypothetical protein AEB_P0197 [Altererythrobacter sp. B11]